MPDGRMQEIIFLNGKFLPKRQALISPLEPGFLYGFGLFETMRWRNDMIVYFDAHLKRLDESRKLLGIERAYPQTKLKDIIRKLVNTNGLPDACVRLTLSKREKGTDILITARRYRPYSRLEYKRGFSTCVSSLRQNKSFFLAQLKTTNYLLYRLAYKEAIGRGFQEAIILNHKGYVAETSRCNLFFVKDAELFTPALDCGCLDGITRRVVFDAAGEYGIKVFEGNFTITDLSSSDEAFLTNSLMGIMPLASIEHRRITRGSKQNKLTRLFMEKYRSLSAR